MANRFSILGLLVLWALHNPLSACADDPKPDFLIGFGDVPEEVQNCVLQEGRSIEECDDQQPIDSGLKAGAHYGIDSPLPFDDHKSFYIQSGIHVAAHVLTFDEVVSDPIRKQVDDDLKDKKLSRGVWVSHTLEIRPRVKLGFHPASGAGNPIARSLLLGFLPQYSLQTYVIKRYDVPNDFPKNPASRLAVLRALLAKSVKNFIRLPSEFIGTGLNPGESLQFESYVGVSALPALSSPLQAFNVGPLLGGAFSRAGFEYFRSIDYRRFTIQKHQKGLLRVLLESPRLRRYGPFVDVGLWTDLGIYDINYSIARAGYRWISEKNFATEYLFDLSHDEAKSALKRAYLFGDFDPAEKLADDDCAALQGQGPLAHIEAPLSTGIRRESQLDATGKDHGSNSHGWRVKFFHWLLGNTHSESDSVETHLACGGQDTQEQEHVNELQKVRQGMRASRIFSTGVKTERGRGDDSHSLWVKFNFTSHKAKREELQEFLRVAGSFTDLEDSESTSLLQQESARIQPVKGGDGVGEVHAYLSMEFDSHAISTILNLSPEERESRFKAAFESWFAQENKADAYKDHLKALEKFIAAAQKGLKKPDEIKQAQAFLSGIEKTGIDLYPFAAMLSSLPDRDHVQATAQIYISDGKTDDRLIDTHHFGRLFSVEEEARQAVQP